MFNVWLDGCQACSASVFRFGIRSAFYSMGVSTVVRAVVRLGSNQHCKAFVLQPQIGFDFWKNYMGSAYQFIVFSIVLYLYYVLRVGPCIGAPRPRPALGSSLPAPKAGRREASNQ